MSTISCLYRGALFIALLIASGVAEACNTCGCRGGPGYRGPDGKCLSWDHLNSVCGVPPTKYCAPEDVHTKEEDEARKKK